MKQYKYHFHADFSALSYIPEDAVFFDIETTGLSRERSIIYMIGCAYIEKEELRLVQWFNDDAVSEEDLLKSFINILEHHVGPLISFNGDTFDLPFLRTHMEYHHMSYETLSSRESLDLYKVLRGYAKVFAMKTSTQKAWEEFLGIHREDIYDGGKLISVYKKYLSSKDKDLEEILLLHNREDIRYLASIPCLLSYEQIRNGEFQVISIKEEAWQSDDIMVKSSLAFYLSLDKPLPKSFSLESPLGYLEYQKKDSLLKLTLSVWEGKMYHFYADYKNYYYLPSEDRAIHKSVAVYVDSAHRQKARKCNCYLPLEGVFLPCPKYRRKYNFSIKKEEEYALPLFQTSYEDKRHYLNFDDLFPGQKMSSKCILYLSQIMQAIFLERI